MFNSLMLFCSRHDPGDEKEAWSDDDNTDTEQEKGGEKSSESTRGGHTHPTSTSEPAKDGYSSGDLGDVSQFYATEVGVRVV